VDKENIILLLFTPFYYRSIGPSHLTAGREREREREREKFIDNQSKSDWRSVSTTPCRVTPPLGARAPAYDSDYYTPTLRLALWHALPCGNTQEGGRGGGGGGEREREREHLFLRSAIEERGTESWVFVYTLFNSRISCRVSFCVCGEDDSWTLIPEPELVARRKINFAICLPSCGQSLCSGNVASQPPAPTIWS